MLYVYIFFAVLVVLFFLALSIAIKKFKIALKLVCLNSGFGFLLLIVLKLLSGLIGINVYINIVSVTISTVFGPLGLAMFYLINFVFL